MENRIIPGRSLIMPAHLQLEYVCTEADLREAQSLHVRHKYGGKAAWFAWLKLLSFLAGFLTLVYFRCRGELPPRYMPWVLLGTAALFLWFYFGLRSSVCKKSDTSTRMEVSERELVFRVGESQTTLLWSGFSQCLESPNLFVLLDRPKGALYVVPKRAFPDEAAQNWFRGLAHEPPPLAESSDPTSLLAPLPADAVVLNYQLTFRDYLIRSVSSWRTKGIALLILGLTTGACLWQVVYPSPDAVNGPGTVFAIMLPTVFAILMLVILMVSGFWWYAERQYRAPKRMVLSNQGVDFSDQDGRGLVSWSTYQNYLENRWCIFVWSRRSMAWLMFPKRNFASPADLEQFRGLLQAHLHPSRWFFY